jgi:hypothetical protein
MNSRNPRPTGFFTKCHRCVGKFGAARAARKNLLQTYRQVIRLEGGD